MDKSVIGIMPDTIISSPIAQTHIIDLPAMCPVSHNPQKGSTLEISYISTDKSLEVYSLDAYIHSYIGGKLWRGDTFIRDMEQTIRAIQIDCCEVLDTEVYVKAVLILDSHKLVLQAPA